MKKTEFEKRCFVGPFKGEYGHFLAHTLPFLMYLHKKNVKVVYCGMAIHEPLLVDSYGNQLFSEFVPLRDFFGEIAPNSNSTQAPQDVQEVIFKFEQRAIKSGLPFWNIGDDFYYWFVHRVYTLKKYTYTYDLGSVYKGKSENAVCIFPRQKGAEMTPNNGGPWDYEKIIEELSVIFDKVYVVGHPSQSLTLKGNDKTEFRITSNNIEIVEACSNANLIITQHSGVNNLGVYLKKQVLIIYSGGNAISDIGSINNTLFFRSLMNETIPLKFAFNLNEIVESAKKYSNNYVS